MYTGTQCKHGYKEKYRCVQCWPENKCLCGSGKHRKNCCEKSKSCALRRQASADRRKELLEAREEARKEMARQVKEKQACPCGFPKWEDCLLCRIEKKINPSTDEQALKGMQVVLPCMPKFVPNRKPGPMAKTCSQEMVSCDQIFNVRGQTVAVPKSTEVLFLNLNASAPENFTTYVVHGCKLAVLHGTAVRFL
jgi:hypothetical protein